MMKDRNTYLLVLIVYPMSLPASPFILVCLFLFSSAIAAAQEPNKSELEAPLLSGHSILVGTNDGVGPLASIGISSTPLGSAFIFGGDRPDIFVSSDRWYPGFHVYRWMRDTPQGVPVFSQPIEVDVSDLPKLEDHSLQDHAVASYIFQTSEGQVYGVWVRRSEFLVALFDTEQMRFDIVSRVILSGLPRVPRAATGLLRDDGQLVLFLSVSDGVPYKAPGSHRKADYRPFDGSGIWRGGIARDAVYQTSFSFPKAPESAVAEEIVGHQNGGQFGINGMTIVKHNGQPKLIIGTLMGGLHALSGLMPASDSDGVTKKPVVDENGISLRHPETWTNVIGYPSRDSTSTDLLVSGEGGMYYYKRLPETGRPDRLAFKQMGEVQQVSAELFGGTLVVPSVVDWNGDGQLDIVAGNSQGFLLFFENVAENSQPRFAPPQRMAVAGELVHIQGHYGSVQGPGEARWGYTCPNVCDWNDDGLPDILMNDIRGMHSVYLNAGMKTRPRLASAKALYLDDLDMHGTWRTRPGIGSIDGQNVYITLDDDDQFHIYSQIDAYNLKDGGKLRLDDGSPISANFLEAGGRGRTKFECVDWDNDGNFDLVVGTPRHGSVPVADESGLPWSQDKAGAAVLLLHNEGSNKKPIFAYPKLMHYLGMPVHLGQHSCSPAAAYFDNEPDLIVGTENGRFIYYNRENISWK
jgi:hypothetical protein